MAHLSPHLLLLVAVTLAAPDVLATPTQSLRGAVSNSTGESPFVANTSFSNPSEVESPGVSWVDVLTPTEPCKGLTEKDDWEIPVTTGPVKADPQKNPLALYFISSPNIQNIRSEVERDRWGVPAVNIRVQFRDSSRSANSTKRVDLADKVAYFGNTPHEPRQLARQLGVRGAAIAHICNKVNFVNNFHDQLQLYLTKRNLYGYGETLHKGINDPKGLTPYAVEFVNPKTSEEFVKFEIDTGKIEFMAKSTGKQLPDVTHLWKDVMNKRSNYKVMMWYRMKKAEVVERLAYKLARNAPFPAASLIPFHCTVASWHVGWIEKNLKSSLNDTMEKLANELRDGDAGVKLSEIDPKHKDSSWRSATIPTAIHNSSTQPNNLLAAGNRRLISSSNPHCSFLYQNGHVSLIPNIKQSQLNETTDAENNNLFDLVDGTTEVGEVVLAVSLSVPTSKSWKSNLNGWVIVGSIPIENKKVMKNGIVLGRSSLYL